MKIESLLIIYAHKLAYIQTIVMSCKVLSVYTRGSCFLDLDIRGALT